MKHLIHTAASRGNVDFGWLQSHHTFSFGHYYNPERMHFGVLRVLNDDTVAGGRGFDTHPHSDMEIISLPLEGELEHRDSMGNRTLIRQGDIQVMSAGTGVQHSEYNKNQDKPVKFLQIWIFPSKKQVAPRYDQVTLNPADSHNTLQQILSPAPEKGCVWIHQQAWFHLSRMDAGVSLNYEMKRKGNGAYIFVLAGSLKIEEMPLQERDGMGIWDTVRFSLTSVKDAAVLIMEVPMDAGIPV